MYLKRLFIRNYRSINELDLSFLPGKNVIIGRNNSGKSNIVKSIDTLFGQSNPTYAKTENISENDFHCWKETDNGKTFIKQNQEINIWGELKREPGDKINYSDMYKCFGFYVSGNYKTLTPNRISKDKLPSDFDSIFNLDEELIDKYYVNPKKPAQKPLEREFENKYIFAFAFKAIIDDQGNIEKDIRFLYREDDTSDWILSFRASIRNEFLQSAIIPSFRDPSNQLRPVSWNWYGKLMKYLTDQHANSPALAAAFDQVKQASDVIFSDVSQKVKQSCIDVAFPDTELLFQFVAEKRGEIYKNCQIYIDDGFKSQLVDKGSGIQSATIIGLFNYYTKNVNSLSSALLCIEEPEIYLHPHGRRVISDRLDDFLDNGRNQVILTTHSVEFIRSCQNDLNVILVNKDNGDTSAKNINLKDYKKLLINNNQNEVFFAQKVIICEGFDEYVIRSISNELFPGQLDTKNISVISVSGKDNFCSMVNLTLELGVETYLCADFDYLLRDKDAKAKQYGGKPHSSILSLSPKFFKQKCIYDNNGEAHYGTIRSIREHIKKLQEQSFYCAKSMTEITCIDLKDTLTDLRSHGVFILPGEIENLVKDTSFLNAGDKLSWEKIYEMNSLFGNGKKPSDLFTTEEFNEFLAHIIK